MVTRLRSYWMFAATAVGIAVLVVVAWAYMFSTPRTLWQEERAAQRQARSTEGPVTGSAMTAAPPAPPVVAQAVPISVSTCPPQASVPTNAERRDGAFALDAAMAADPLPSASAFMAVGREAAKQGRVRDAEVAFIAACRVAERLGGSHSAPVADAKAQLGEHYLALAARQAGGDGNTLFQRAATLFSESADAYSVSLGKNASRTRLAEQRLAAVRTGSAAEAAGRMPAPMQRSNDSTVLGAAPSSMIDEEARLAARQLIFSDPELAQLESDIGRLQAQASRVTRDAAGLRRRDAEAQARRDSQCADKPCMLRWYAQRRSQLLNEF
ncbi:hypothetical protein WG902_18115 [Ramlibacter sp. PS3R-8]|uniref:hypothetical protein n=1 Tax=Ramlibacter sp. PS3R-8 TaxID=3133437 RepID=UPI0030AB0C40